MSKLEEIKERLEKSTAGPWKFEKSEKHGTTDCGVFLNPNGLRIMDFGDYEQYYPASGNEPEDPDIQFIENVHSDIEYLLSKLKQAVSGIQEIRKSVDEYLDIPHYKHIDEQAENILKLLND